MNRAQWIATIFLIGVLRSFAALVYAEQAEGKPNEAVRLADVPAPFELSESKQKQVDAILRDWEKRSQPIRWFHCEFTRWQYDSIFAPRGEPEVAHGVISYRWPNRASYRQIEPRREAWSREANAVYELNYEQKLVVERLLPEGSRNHEIESWPLPLLYRVRAADLKRDYWVRVSPEKPRAGELRLEFHPRRRPADLHATLLVAADVMNGRTNFCPYQSLDVLLDAENMTPLGLRVGHDKVAHTSFAFTEVRVGSDEFEFGGIICAFPAAVPPKGWKKISNVLGDISRNNRRVSTAAASSAD